MQKIPLNIASAGMRLARDVFGKTNAPSLLCPKKTLLTEEIITSLKNMAIDFIYVEIDPIRQEGYPTLEEILAALEHRFKKVRQDPLMSKIHDIFADYYKCSTGNSSD